MKVSIILTVASLCLAGLAKSAPVEVSTASEIIKTDEEGVAKIDFGYVVSSVNAMFVKFLTEGEDAITKEDKEFFAELDEIDKLGLLDGLDEQAGASELEDGFESVITQEMSDKVSEAMQSARASLLNSEGMSHPEKRATHEELYKKSQLTKCPFMSTRFALQARFCKSFKLFCD